MSSALLFNLPLAFMSHIHVVPVLSHRLRDEIHHWSFGGQTEQFGNGILSLSGSLYFLFIAAIMLYVCIVLLGRRHWARGDDAGIQAGHFALRCLALAVMSVAVVFILQNHDLRRDATSEQLTVLSPYTINLVNDLKKDYAQSRLLESQILPLEAKQKEAADAEKKARDEKLAKEKADAAKNSGSKTSAAKPGSKPSEPKPSAAPPKAEDKKSDAKAAAAFADTAKLDKLKDEFAKLKIQGPVLIDAYISPDVPESYIQTRINLLNVLHEFKIVGGDMVELNINEIDRFDKMAEVAKARYNIVPKEVVDTRNGTYQREQIFMGVAFTCGLEKVVLPFIERGLPPEYELVRSLCTVTKQKRKRIGVLETDAHVMGNFGMSGMTPDWMFIQELKKQYEVVQVNPAELMAPPKPGESEKRYDVLLAIQPSSLGPRDMESFVAAVRAGMPTVIFEDPYFLWMRGIPGTYQPRRQQNPMMGFGQENQEKGDIRHLWQLLGIDFSDGGSGDEFNPMSGGEMGRGTEKVVWQRYNPYPKLGNTIQPEWVFIDNACGAEEPFSEKDPISSKLQHVFMIAPGFIDDTPEAVKRLVAKWYNRQYARQLSKEMNDLKDRFDKTEDEDKANQINDEWSETRAEYNEVSSGGDGKKNKTIQPSALKDDTNLEQLISKLLGKGHSRAVADLVTDLKNRFPLPASDDEADEGGTVLLTKAEAEKRTADAARLEKEADALRQRSMGAPRLSHAAKYKSEAARLKQTAARLTAEGISLENTGSSDDALLKQRISWLDAAARLKDQAAELLSKTGQNPLVTPLDDEAADQKNRLAGYKEKLADMKTVGDVIKYAQDVVALQLQDRHFTPLIETGPGPNAGTVPVNRIAEGFGMGGGPNPFRSLYYQPSQGEPFVLAAHITGKPRESMTGSQINVVLVADAEMVNDMFFEMRERGTMPGQDIVFDFDNVTFALNALDALAGGDSNFMELRKRRPQHRTLARFDRQTAEARKSSAAATEKDRKEHDDAIRNVVKELEEIESKGDRMARIKHWGPTETEQWKAQQQRAGPQGGGNAGGFRQDVQRQDRADQQRVGGERPCHARHLQAVGGARAADSALGGGGHRLLPAPFQGARRRRQQPLAITLRKAIMKDENTKTVCFLLAAVALTATAWFSAPDGRPVATPRSWAARSFPNSRTPPRSIA